jgi:hypothetical protein
MTTYYTDRSRIQEWQRCPRARYLGYSLLRTGVRKVRATIPLATGAHTHDGLADMLRQVQQFSAAGHDNIANMLRVDIDRSVSIALDGYRAELQERGLDIELGEDGAYVAAEQMALVEGMLRAYALKGLGELVERYEILEVEREDCWHRFTSLYPENTSLVDDYSIDLQARADALLRERSTGDLYILSFKTAASKDWRQDSDNRHDVQGLSEAAVVERRLRETDPDARIMGIQMVYLYKGRRSQRDDSGPWLTDSPLIRGWTREGITDRDYAWRYKWDGPDTWPDTGRLRGHTLGKGWSKFDAWTATGGVKAWIDLLASGTVQPDIDRNPFDDTYAMPLPIYRQDRDMLDWIEQAQSQERDVISRALTAENIRIDDPTMLHQALNGLFPQYRRSCDWPSKCQFQEICFGDDTMLTSPCSTGLYQLRQAHHEPERKAVEDAGRAA